jgi:hypothetical protein
MQLATRFTLLPAAVAQVLTRLGESSVVRRLCGGCAEIDASVFGVAPKPGSRQKKVSGNQPRTTSGPRLVEAARRGLDALRGNSEF